MRDFAQATHHLSATISPISPRTRRRSRGNEGAAPRYNSDLCKLQCNGPVPTGRFRSVSERKLGGNGNFARVATRGGNRRLTHETPTRERRATRASQAALAYAAVDRRVVDCADLLCV